MTDQDRPRLYLITPPAFEPEHFPARLEAVLDSADFACIRLAMATRDEDLVARAADTLREIAHRRDIPLVIEHHILLASRLGLDGVHLSDGARSVRHARKELGPDAIVGAFCADSRHEGLSAGEAGADYVAFGPAGVTPLGSGGQADLELYSWWSEMIEVPLVAEGALTTEVVAALTPATDFFAVGEEIWHADDPVQALRRLFASWE